MNQWIKKIISVEGLTVILTVGLIGLTCFYLLANYKVKSRTKDQKVIEPGTQFAFFKETLQDKREVGFITNKNMSEEKNDGTFLMAQYMLAPTVLNLNEKHPDLNILDYTKPVFTVFTIKSYGARPLLTSPYGQVLVETIK